MVRRVIILLFSLALLDFRCFDAGAMDSMQITEHVEVVPGAVNGAFVHQSGKVLAVYGDPRQNPPPVDTVLFTHHRRDVVWAGRGLVANGASAVVPQAELSLFKDVEQYWSKFREARFHDYDQQSTKILVSPLSVTQTVTGGKPFEWEGLQFEVLDAPGYTRGAVAYVLEIDRKRIAFTGDLIYGDGRIWDWYSMQDAIPEAKLRGYHGYAARSAELLESLRLVAERQPDIIIPARGPVIENPQEAIDRLTKRLRAAYANYLSISALRFYFGDDHIRLKANRILGPEAEVEWMPNAETVDEELPKWVIPMNTSRLLLADDKSGFLIDCGSDDVIKRIKEMMREAWLTAIDGVYVTHYHDDHTDRVAAIADEFKCPVYACEEQVDVLENPGAYRLPAMTDIPIPCVQGMAEGSKLRWKEFEMTFYFYPGQTLYHGGLLVERQDGGRILFAGDSFTPSGIDDYCLLNRDFLHPGMGYFRCLDLLREINPDCTIINEHVFPMFRFSKDQLNFMTRTLEERVELLRELFPWDDPNYGLDEGWARLYPYERKAFSGGTFKLYLKIMNHSPQARTFRAKFHVPEGWKTGLVRSSTIGPREEESIRVEIMPPAGVAPGTYVITADIQSAGIDLREWTEAFVVIDGE